MKHNSKKKGINSNPQTKSYKEKLKICRLNLIESKNKKVRQNLDCRHHMQERRTNCKTRSRGCRGIKFRWMPNWQGSQEKRNNFKTLLRNLAVKSHKPKPHFRIAIGRNLSLSQRSKDYSERKIQTNQIGTASEERDLSCRQKSTDLLERRHNTKQASKESNVIFLNYKNHRQPLVLHFAPLKMI